MERVKLSKDGKRILRALYNNEYPSQVPDKDFDEFNLLEIEGFAHSVHTKGADRSEKHAARITNEGRAYVTSNPKLKAPKRAFDWKWLVGILVSIILAFVTLWFSRR